MNSASARNTPETSLVELDPWLAPHEAKLRDRTAWIEMRRATVVPPRQPIAPFAAAHEFFGLHRTAEGWVFRERAPGAVRLILVGDMTGWKENADYELRRKESGFWERAFPPEAFAHGQLYKLHVFWTEGNREQRGERIPSHARRVVQDPTTYLFSAQVWEPSSPYVWKHPNFTVPKRAPLIYEAHVGMGQEEPKVGSYLEFTRNVLPRIAAAGYNTIQLMAVQEHPYYGSFGYQVSSFFAPSSRFGTPEELMELVDTAHGYGIAVIMDLVHSHAVKNEVEGLSRFDGTETLYFHGGARGDHVAWNTRCFDYGKPETLHFLLSNCRYWLDAFKFDGYRFDGVTSMIYLDHGLGQVFTNYDQYFDANVDNDALAYLSLANEVIHEIRPDAITVAEEVSGMPGTAAARVHGGIGFDYRLAMGVPDYWIKLIKEHRDEEWSVAGIWWELTNRRKDERTIGYAESHDQAFVGDKTIMFRLADQEMYWHMRKSDSTPVIERAVALHKMIRLVTLATAGNGYLNFMGNEFGHPEWIDFPREGNGWSFEHARRKWSLRDNPLLRFEALAEFDAAMVKLAERATLLECGDPQMRYEHVTDMVLAFERAGLLFVFNFNPSRSYSGLSIPVSGGEYRIVLDSDAPEFGGHGSVDTEMTYPSSPDGTSLRIYSPSRTALVFEKV